ERERFAQDVRELADVLADVANAPGDRDRRQRAAERALAIARARLTIDAPPDSATALAGAMVRIVAKDVMIFAGVDAEQATAAIRADRDDVEVQHPVHAPRIPFGLDRRRERRRQPRSSREF